MATTLVFRRALQVLLPATLLLAACGKDDEPAAPAPERGKIVFVNAASHIAPTTLKFAIDDVEKASVAYATGSGYQSLATGSRSVRVSAGTQTALTQSIAVDKDKSYTFIAAPTNSSTTVRGVLFDDDLSVPAQGKSRIRVINFRQGPSATLRLSQVTPTAGGPVIVDIVNNADAFTATRFIDFAPGTYSLSILDDSKSTLAEVGDGSGSGTGTKKYEEGKVYTVVVSGIQGSLNQDQKLKAFLIQNN